MRGFSRRFQSEPGAKKPPFYRVVAIDRRAPRDGRPLEFLGTYDPLLKPAKIALESERIEHWLSRGAQLSPAVRSLVRRSRKQQAAGGAS